MTALSREDRRWLDAAARMARPFVGTTGRNPCVGALVREAATGRVVGRGVTARGGQPHAEPIALEMAGAAARGAALYVTLEPCFHQGMTPPCVDAVLGAGVARVVVAMRDPDPRTSGQSLERLRQAGIEVALADPAGNPAWLHEGYLSAVGAGRPFVSAKLAVSADGKIGRQGQPNVAITGEAARRYTQALRARQDAILVGAETARTDNPSLTVRLQGLEERSPFRWVALGERPADPALRLFTDGGPPTGVIATDSARADGLPAAIERLIVPAAAEGGIDWSAALRELARRRTNMLLVEGGAAALRTLLAAGLVDRFYLFRSDRQVGADGVAAGDLETAIAEAGLRAARQRPLDADRLTIYERAR